MSICTSVCLDLGFGARTIWFSFLIYQEYITTRAGKLVNMDSDCVTFVPFTHYNWTFDQPGWLPWKQVNSIPSFTQQLTSYSSPTAFCLIASFCAIAYWMSIELLVLVYVTFKRHNGLYFWSIIVTTVGIILQTTGYILKNFENNSPLILTVIICKVGWVSNVTGFAIVLWSRLHLVVTHPQILKSFLIMIVVNGLVCHTPIVVFEFGLNFAPNHQTYYRGMQAMERIQQTIFTIQETVISSLYIYHTARFLKSGSTMHVRKIIGVLVCVQVLVISLDIMLTYFDYTDKFMLKCTIHPLVYAVKLKLEFIVLNQLQTLVGRGLTTGLHLPSLQNIDFNSDEASSGQDSPSTSDASAKSLPGYERNFISKTGVVRMSPRGSGATLITRSSNVEKEQQGHVRGDSEKTLTGELDLKNVYGKPDRSRRNDGLEDMERLYLGTWNGQEKAS
jgi:hypothetical protein